jgi:hypothetical protein
VCNAHVDDNLVADNRVEASGGGSPFEGIFVAVQVFSGGFTPVANHNTIRTTRSSHRSASRLATVVLVASRRSAL